MFQVVWHMLVIYIMMLSMIPTFTKLTVYCGIYVDKQGGNYNIVCPEEIQSAVESCVLTRTFYQVLKCPHTYALTSWR